MEGYEDRALKGTAKTLDRFRPLVVVELWPPAMQQQGTSVEAVADELAKHDYRLFAAHRRQLLPLAELPRGDTGVYAFCFHKDRVPNVLSAEKGRKGEGEKGRKGENHQDAISPSPLRPFSPSQALVSIVIPCYKGSRFLAETIDSCLKQTYREIEVIVVDDASPENDAEIAESRAARDSRVRVVRRAQNGGVSRAYNSGYAVARGDYFTRLSQDDMFREDAIEIMLRCLQEAPANVGLVYCDMQKVDENGRWLSRWNQADDPYAADPDAKPVSSPDESALFPTQEVGLCVMWRRSVYEAVGPFRPRYDFAEDYEFYLRRLAELPPCQVQRPSSGRAGPVFLPLPRHPKRHGLADAAVGRLFPGADVARLGNREAASGSLALLEGHRRLRAAHRRVECKDPPQVAANTRGGRSAELNES